MRVRNLRVAVRCIALCFTLHLALAPLSAAPPPTHNWRAEIVRARADWVATSATVYDLLVRLGGSATEVRDLGAKLKLKRQQIADLERKRDRTMEELRHGEFCSGCGETKSEILAKGERFPHAGQHERPATPEELEKKRREFENQLDPLRADEKQLRQRKDVADTTLSNLYTEYLKTYPIYQVQRSKERDLRIAAWLADSGALAARVRQRNGDLIAAERAYAVASPHDREPLKLRVEERRRELEDAVLDARAATARAVGEARDFALATNNDLDRLGRTASSISGGLDVGIPDGWYIEHVLRGLGALDYAVGPVQGTDSFFVGARDARNLLEGPPTESAHKTESTSARDLLEGR